MLGQSSESTKLDFATIKSLPITRFVVATNCVFRDLTCDARRRIDSTNKRKSHKIHSRSSASAATTQDPQPLSEAEVSSQYKNTIRCVIVHTTDRAKMASLSDKSVWDEVEDGIGEEVLKMSTEEIVQRTRLLDSEIKIMKSEVLRVTHELQAMKDKIKENTEKIKVNKTLPYLVSNVIELLDVDPNDQEEDGANVDLDSQRKGKCAVIKTSTRQTYFLPVIGLVDAEKLKPGDLVGVNKDSYLILETLPTEYDSRVKAMEVDERPTEQYSDIGGLDKQIQELVEAIVLPMNHKEKFENLGIQPPKGVLMYGPPGTGKTLLARACAAQTKATFLKLAGPQLVQMFIGDGAKLVRDAFALAKEKAPSIIFIDELDAIGTKRFDSEKAGDREVQRTMLELLNQLDGFQPNMQVKVKMPLQTPLCFTNLSQHFLIIVSRNTLLRFVWWSLEQKWQHVFHYKKY